MSTSGDALGGSAWDTPASPTPARRRLKKRYKVGIALLALLAISLTSLGVHAQWLQGRWGASQASSALAQKLTELQGVTRATSTYDPFGLPDSTVKVAVAFRADASPSDWSRAAMAVRAAASSNALRASSVSAVFTEARGSAHARVEPLLFTPSVVATEIGFWRSLNATVGDTVSLRLGHPSTSSGSTGLLTRDYTVAAASDMAAVAARWPASTPSDSRALTTTWQAPGIQSYRFPTPVAMHAVAALAKVAPLASSRPGSGSPRTSVAVIQELRGFTVQLVEGSPETSSTVTPDHVAAEAARIAFAEGASSLQELSAGRLVALTSGPCPTVSTGTSTVPMTLVTSAADQAFADQLRAAGFAQPAAVKAGSCQPAQR